MTNGLFGGCFGHFNMYPHLKQATNSQLRVSTLFVVFEQLFRFKKTTMANQKDTENNAFAFRVCNTVFNEIKILNQTQA